MHMGMAGGIILIVVLIIFGLVIIIRTPYIIGILAILLGLMLCCTMTIHGTMAGIMLLIAGIGFLKYAKLLKKIMNKLFL